MLVICWWYSQMLDRKKYANNRKQTWTKKKIKKIKMGNGKWYKMFKDNNSLFYFFYLGDTIMTPNLSYMVKDSCYWWNKISFLLHLIKTFFLPHINNKSRIPYSFKLICSYTCISDHIGLWFYKLCFCQKIVSYLQMLEIIHH